MMPWITRRIDALFRDRNAKELLAGSSFALFSRFANFGLGYLFVLLLTQHFGAGAMGAFALATTIVTIFSVLSRIGLDTALVRFVAENAVQNKHDVASAIFRKALAIVTPIGLVFSLGIFFFSPYIAKYVFHKEHLESYVQLAGLALLPLTLSHLYAAYFRGLKKIRAFAFIKNISVNLFSTLSIFTLLLFTDWENVPLAAYLLGVGFTLLLSIYLSRNQMVATYMGKAISLRAMLSVSVPLLLGSCMGMMVMGWADIIMLGIFRTEREVGIYSVVVKVALITVITLRAVNAVTAPKFAELHKQGEYAEMQGVLSKSAKLIFWTSFPIFLTLLFFPSAVLSIFGPEFVLGRSALAFITIGMFFTVITGPVVNVLQMTGNQVAYQNVLLITIAVNIGLNLLLIPRFGIEGAAVASMVAVIFRNLTFAVYIRRVLNLDTLYLPGLELLGERKVIKNHV